MLYLVPTYSPRTQSPVFRDTKHLVPALVSFIMRGREATVTHPVQQQAEGLQLLTPVERFLSTHGFPGL